jgi:hypothetical protein
VLQPNDDTIIQQATTQRSLQTDHHQTITTSQTLQLF